MTARHRRGTVRRTAKGLALWPGALIDQHFLKRQRNNRLLSAVFDRPTLVGVGIDESTALVITLADRKARVIGDSCAIAYRPAGSEEQPRMRLLQPGDELAFDEWKRTEVAAAAAGGGR